MYFVYGLQKTGISVSKLLEKKNEDFRIWDDNKITRENLKKIFNDRLFFKPSSNNLTKFKKIFVSPGISLKKNKFRLVNRSSKLQRDLNLYTHYLNNKNLIAITGTNGKSTTTKLIGDILKNNKIKTFVGGNIGEPLCNSLLKRKKYDFHVVELSSFQLETVKSLNTIISVITNLSSDHLDRYKNITDYINQKKNIISKFGMNLISIDDIYSKKIFKNKTIKNKISFSIYDKKANVYICDEYILDNYFKKNKKLYIKNKSKDLYGHFNNQNIIISYICSKLLKIPEKNFLKIITKFKGLPHRSNIIFENKNLLIINNSKSTNINSTINSISNYNEIHLILGGIAKENNFEILLKFKENINCVYVYGKSANLIEKKLKKNLLVKKFKNLKLVVNQIFKDLQLSKLKSSILFAPACSSYDQYFNFEKRGEHFTQLIKHQLKNRS